MDTSGRTFEDITGQVQTGGQGHPACDPSDFRKRFSLSISLLVEFVQIILAMREAMPRLKLLGQEYGRVWCVPAGSEPAARRTASVWP